ncbi:unnamed protein product, partial [Rotaria sp. Silwood2]
MTDVAGINFYYLFSVFGDYEKVIEYYTELLWDEKFIDYPKCIILNIMIGYNYFHLLQYDEALFHYDIALSSLDDNNKLRGEIYIHIGDVWRVRDNVETALSNYKKALEIFTSQDVDDHDIAKICRKVSDIYLEQNNYDDAIVYQEQADLIDENYR